MERLDKMKQIGLIFGGDSEIGQWVSRELKKNNIEAIKIPRQIVNTGLHADITIYDDVLEVIRLIGLQSCQVSYIFVCAGTTERSYIDKSIISEWINTIDVNLIGPYHIYKALVQSELWKDTQIKLIVFGSTSIVSRPKEHSAYSVSKVALEQLVTYINNSPPCNIRASCLRLGTCQTSFSSDSHKENIIQEEDIALIIRLLINCRCAILPETITLRPINS